MPTVGKKKFAYTKAGMAKAKAEAKRTGKKLVGGPAGTGKKLVGGLAGGLKVWAAGLKGMGSKGISKKVPTMTTDFHKSKAAAKKDKGKPNTPGEMRRTIQGKTAAGAARNTKYFRGDFDKGKKIRYQRRGK